jgi:hypothetical protein
MSPVLRSVSAMLIGIAMCGLLLMSVMLIKSAANQREEARSQRRSAEDCKEEADSLRRQLTRVREQRDRLADHLQVLGLSGQGGWEGFGGLKWYDPPTGLILKEPQDEAAARLSITQYYREDDVPLIGNAIVGPIIYKFMENKFEGIECSCDGGENVEKLVEAMTLALGQSPEIDDDLENGTVMYWWIGNSENGDEIYILLERRRPGSNTDETPLPDEADLSISNMTIFNVCVPAP